MKALRTLLLAGLVLVLAACGGASRDVAVVSSAVTTTSAALPTVTVASTGLATSVAQASPTLVPTLASVPHSSPTPSPTSTGTATGVPATAVPSPTTVASATVKPVVEAATPTQAAAAHPALGGKIAFVRGKDTWLYRPRTGETRKLISGTTEARWSPDGKSIVFTRADGLYLAGGDGASERKVATGSGLLRPVWAPDGTRIAWQQNAAANQAAGDIWVLELGSGEARKIAHGAYPAWAPDSKRLAYVTVPADDPPRRSELRIVSYAGEHDWVVVKDLPPNTPAIGIPQNEQSRTNLEHLMANPFWDRDGRYVYVASSVLYQALSDFFIWERADATNGGSTFLGELNGADAFPSPDRQAVLFSASNPKGDSWFVARALAGQNQAWAATRPNATDVTPAWAPDSKAVAYYHCELDHPDRCNLQLLTPQGGSVLLRDVVGGTAPDGARDPSLDWGRDG